MSEITSKSPYAPIAIGGVGGSGTRVIARILKQLGYFLGDDHNAASDYLWYTFLFVRPDILKLSQDDLKLRIDLFIQTMTTPKDFTPEQKSIVYDLAKTPVDHGPMAKLDWLQERVKRASTAVADPTGRWGWKEPNTHVLLDRLADIIPNMRYIHVTRNGLDMAYSQNQNQLKVWGQVLFGLPYLDGAPAQSLKFWCHAHRRVLGIKEKLGKNFLFLNFDDLCANPENGLIQLCKFLGDDIDTKTLEQLSGYIDPPASIGRFRKNGLATLAAEDVAYAKGLGFTTQ